MHGQCSLSYTGLHVATGVGGQPLVACLVVAGRGKASGRANAAVASAIMGRNFILAGMTISESLVRTISINVVCV